MRGRAETVLTALKSDSSSLAFASDELLSDGAFIKGSCNPNLNLSAKPNLNLSPNLSDGAFIKGSCNVSFRLLV